ncbi:MAG: hypothetical protein ACP5N0_04505 [Methanosarcina sp.]|jgi:hypothetical protein|uniref:hypothetical protein n=1 Tax=Methanosarcina sp. TaxID=2213 RepID=UPI003BB789A5
METLKELAGKSIVALVTTFSLLLILFPVGWIILFGLVIGELSDKRSVEARILGVDIEV